MDQNLPNTCKTKFSNPNQLHEFTMVITPDEGYWRGGKFVFSVSVPEDYNMAVSGHLIALSPKNVNLSCRISWIRCPVIPPNSVISLKYLMYTKIIYNHTATFVRLAFFD